MEMIYIMWLYTKYYKHFISHITDYNEEELMYITIFFPVKSKFDLAYVC